MAWEGLRGQDVSYAVSPLESERFGFGVGRLTVGYEIDDLDAAGRQLTQRLDGCDEELVVVRYPAWAVPLGAAVAASGRATIAAGSLTYWEVPAARLVVDSAAMARDGLTVATGGGGAVERDATRRAVADVVADSFAGYGNHYLANPRIDPALALAGYQDWALRVLDGGGDDVLVLRCAEEPVGFATVAGSQDGRDLEILLAGMTSASQGRGWYGHVLAAVGRSARDRGYDRVIISTQTHNVRVQRAWVSAGFKPFAAVETLHSVAQG